MHVLIPFDIVPVSKRVPFGVAPASEHAMRYAIEAFGPHEDVRITAVHLAGADDELPGSIGASEIETMAAEHDVSVDTDVRTVENADSMDAIRAGILGIVEETDVDVVVMGYEEKSFVDSVFHDSTASRVLDAHGIPVTLVP
jgi:nucleotide-binding universal stress UspA family protein